MIIHNIIGQLIEELIILTLNPLSEVPPTSLLLAPRKMKDGGSRATKKLKRAAGGPRARIC